MSCEHDLGVVGFNNLNGHRIGLYRCGKFNLCVRTQEELTILRRRDMAVCDGCEAFKRRKSDYLVCINRGEPTGKTIDCQCSVDRSIYQCTIHGLCIKKLPTTKTREDFGSQLDGVTICSQCEDVA